MIEHYIENCESARELVKIPVDVVFENLGKEVNSAYADFYPFITQDQVTLYFSSRREENPLKSVNAQGEFTSDIYVSEVKDGQWTKPKNMGPVVNSNANEQCVFVMPDGKKMIIFRDNENVTGDIFTLPLLQLPQKPPVNFVEPVNTDFREYEGCLTGDENMLIISSDKPGGFGETDLYMFHLIFPLYDNQNTPIFSKNEYSLVLPIYFYEN